LLSPVVALPLTYDVYPLRYELITDVRQKRIDHPQKHVQILKGRDRRVARETLSKSAQDLSDGDNLDTSFSYAFLRILEREVMAEPLFD